MDYCAFGDLSQFIKRRNRFSEYYGPDMARVLETYPPGGGGGLNEHLVKHFLRQLGTFLIDRTNYSVCRSIPSIKEPYPSRP
jgi:serine/threonine-protein kinase ULK/ATG1